MSSLEGRTEGAPSPERSPGLSRRCVQALARGQHCVLSPAESSGSLATGLGEA